MNHPSKGVSTWAIEVLVALMLLAVAALVIKDSLRIGVSWSTDGPQAGYFPFYVGIFLALASGWVLLQTARLSNAAAFVSGEKFKRVAAVFIPAALYVFAIYVFGIYAASALFIAFFMRWRGKFALIATIAVSALVPIALFLLFEVWFLVPLPKGPLEALLGY